MASGRETAVAHNNQQSEIITAASTTVTAVSDIVAWRHKETFGVTEEPYIIDTNHHDGPYGVMVDNSDNVWVTEIDGSRVLKFNSSGVYQSMLGQTGLKWGWENFLVAPVATAVVSNCQASCCEGSFWFFS